MEEQLKEMQKEKNKVLMQLEYEIKQDEFVSIFLKSLLESQLKIEKVKMEAYIDCKNLMANHLAAGSKKAITEIERQLSIICQPNLQQA